MTTILTRTISATRTPSAAALATKWVLGPVRPLGSAAPTASSASSAPDWEAALPFDAIPGPRPAPLVGNAWRFLPGIGTYAGLKQKQFLARLHRDFGPVVKVTGMMGAGTIVFLSEPDHFEKVLRTEGQWPERRFSGALEYYQRNHRGDLPESLATAQGKPWGEFRSAVNQVMMKPQNVRQYVEPIDAVAREFVDRMRAIRDSNGQMPDDFFDEVSKWSMESIVFVALDTRLGAVGDPNPEADGVLRAMRDFFRYMHELDFRPSVWKYVSTPALRGLIASLDHIFGVAEKYVRQAMERLRVEGTTTEAQQDRSLTVLENLLLSNDDPNKAVAMAMDMIMAGIDTTAAATCGVLYHLARHPEQQRRLQDELDRVLPDRDAPLTRKKIEELRYMRACIKEAMRFEPLITGNMRNAGKDLVLGGYRIPKGTALMMNNFLACEEERFFPRAADFLPERWLADEEGGAGTQGRALKARHPFAFMPFGFGPRMCVGRRFADLEMESVVARVFLNFSLDWQHPPPDTDIESVLRFRSPLRFTVIDRT